MSADDKIYVFADNEGCLTPGKGQGYDLRHLRMLVEVLESCPRIALVPCTGRSAPYVEALAQCLGLQSVSYPFIVEGGAAFYQVTSDAIRPLISSDGMAALDNLLPAGQFRTELGKYHCRSYYPAGDACVESLFAAVVQIVASHGLGLEVSASAAAVDVTMAGCSKGAAVEAWCTMMNVSIETTAGIGDWDNDLSFLQKVGIPCAPANAATRVKAAARYISPFPHTLGVIDILSRLAEGSLQQPANNAGADCG